MQEWVLNPEQFTVPLTSPPQQNLAIPLSLGLHPVQGQVQGHGQGSVPSHYQVQGQGNNRFSSQMLDTQGNQKWSNNLSLLQQQDQAMLLISTQSGVTMATQMTPSPSSSSSSTIATESSTCKMGVTQTQISLVDHPENPVVSADTLSCIKEASEIIMAAEEPSTSPPPLNR